MAQSYDAILIVSFGGPEGPHEVLPFLENVLRGKNVPQARLLEVAEHYYHFGGVSPINAQNRALIASLKEELAAHGPQLPIYWGNRNWHPQLSDTLGDMVRDGVRNALAFFTSAFGSYSGCRQYLEDLVRARLKVGPAAPQVDKLRAFFNHPGFIESMVERVQLAFDQIPSKDRAAAKLIFTAHSVPLTMAESSPYVAQLREAAKLVCQGIGRADWELVFQSRSGPPGEPWLEPDICDLLAGLDPAATPDVVVVPIGFLSDHMEVIFDLDVQAREVADRKGINLIRAGTVGNHPRFVRMIRDLVVERIEGRSERPAHGSLGAAPDVCPADCCPTPRRGGIVP